MTNSCSTLYISHPVAVRHGALGFNNRSQIVKYFLEQKEQGNGIPATNYNGWKTDSNIHQEHEILDPLLDLVHTWYCNNIVGPRGPKFIQDQVWPNTNFFNIDANVWFQESLPGQISPQHEHGTLSRYSWVYYLDVGEDNSPLTFIKLEDNKNEIFPVDEIHLPVYNDMIVMFPSFMHHKVYPSINKRYIIAGNINDIEYKENE